IALFYVSRGLSAMRARKILSGLEKERPEEGAFLARNKRFRAQLFERNAMSKRQNAKYKLDRRLGENIWGRPKSPVNRREYGPGQHGQRRKGKLSDFGLQLRAKQKL